MTVTKFLSGKAPESCEKYQRRVINAKRGLHLVPQSQRMCCCSVTQSRPTLCDPSTKTAACQASLSFTSSRSLLKLMSIESVMPSNHLILCRPLLLLPSIFPSIRVFSNELALRMRWPKYWSFSFSISPSNEYSGLISFRIDWFDLLVSRIFSCTTVHRHQLFNA